MIRIMQNDLVGKYAAPKFHPVTCANPMPWLIEELRIEVHFDGQTKVWIRNNKSMWFRSDQCWIGTRAEIINDLDMSPRDLRESELIQQGMDTFAVWDTLKAEGLA